MTDWVRALLLGFIAALGCSADADRYVSQEPTPADLVGIWSATEDSLTQLKAQDAPDHTAAADHVIVLVAGGNGGSCRFKTFDSYPGQHHWEKATYVGTPETCDWLVVPTTVDGKPTWVVSIRLDLDVERDGTSWKTDGRDLPAIHGVTFYVRKDAGAPVLWTFIGDPDSHSYMEFRRR